MTFRISLAVLGLLLALLAPASSLAATTFRFSQDANGATATFASTDPSGCLLTEAYVAVQDERRKDGSGPITEPSSAVLVLSRADQCTGEILLAAQGSATLPPEAFRIDGLETATLLAAVDVVDQLTGSAFTVDLSLTWTGSGEPLRVRDRTQVWTEAFTMQFRFDGTDRPALATGTITDGATDFTPEPAREAFLKAFRAGQLTITRNG